MPKKKSKRARRQDALNILRRAKSALERRGWTRGAFARHGRMCALGAINHSVNGSATDEFCLHKGKLKAKEILRQAMADTMGERTGYYGSSIAFYNDARDTHRRDVLRAFTRAISRARSGR